VLFAGFRHRVGIPPEFADRRLGHFEYNAGNPEHSLNGLMPALDNWIYNAKEGRPVTAV
jgi:hypothetical protein